MTAQQTPSMMTLRIIWGAMLSSMGIYVLMTFILQPPEGFEPAENFQVMFIALGGVAAVDSVLALLARPFLFFKKLEGEQVARDDAMARYHTSCVISWAMAEAIAILGFVLFMLSYEQWIIFPFVGVGALLMLILFPRQSHIDRVVGSGAAPGGPTGSSW